MGTTSFPYYRIDFHMLFTQRAPHMHKQAYDVNSKRNADEGSRGSSSPCGTWCTSSSSPWWALHKERCRVYFSADWTEPSLTGCWALQPWPSTQPAFSLKGSWSSRLGRTCPHLSGLPECSAGCSQRCSWPQG